MAMNCLYCGSSNDDDEHRCRRCGRRLHFANPRPAPEGYPVANGGAAVAAARAILAEPPRPRLSDRQDAPPQGSLFGDREPAKVIPFRGGAVAAVTAPPRPKPEPRSTPRTPRSREQTEELPLLDFLPPAPRAPRTLKTSVEAVIYCDAPVATAMHRAVAAALDFGMMLIGVGLFLGAHHLCGGEIFLNKVAISAYVAAAALVCLFYGSLWVIAGGETAGMRWTRLRLVNFDGFQLERRERWVRFAGACLSFAAGGLGLLWALVDEESLTWHDHISKTFPTLEESQSSSFRRI